MFHDTEAFSGFSIKSAEETKRFYGDALGMDITGLPGMEQYGMLELHIKNGHDVLMYEKADHKPATFTVLSFPVDDIDKAVDALVAKGVEMIHYGWKEMPQDEKGIARGLKIGMGPDIAWFADPSGNNLAVLQPPR